MAFEGTIRVLRGLESNRSGQTPAEGELLYTTDEKKLYIGDGTTAGGILIGPGGADFNPFDWKVPVRVATTANGALATAYENGDTVDGVVLSTGDRILLKDQTIGSENGIYTVNATGAPTRATDADASSEVNAGMTVVVEEGTSNADKLFILTTNNPITVGSTSLSFSEISGGGGGDSNYVGEDQTATPTASGTDSLAMGPSASATGTDGFAAGRGAASSMDGNSIALGLDSTASGVHSISMGRNSDATATATIAMGANTTDTNSADATATAAIAIGLNSLGQGTYSLGLGQNAAANTDRSIAIGDSSTSGSAHCIAIGTSANSNSTNNNIAIGRFTDSTGGGSIALGGGSTDAFGPDATASFAISIGSSAVSSVIHAIAIGYNTDCSTTTGQQVAIGSGATTTGNGSVAIGDSVTSTNAGSTSLGANSDATGVSSLALGGALTAGARATAASSIAIGDTALADRTASIVIGQRADVGGDEAIAIGKDSDAATAASIAIGETAIANTGIDGIAIGRYAESGGTSAIAIGGATTYSTGPEATGNYSIAIGRNTLASGVESIAMGHNSESTNVGQISQASGDVNHQSIKFICNGQTTDATATNINPDGGTTNRMIIPASTAWRFRVEAIVRENATGDVQATSFNGAIKRDGANNTALVGSVTESDTVEDAGATSWVWAITANDTDEALQIQVTGEAAHTLDWTAVVRMSEVR